MGRVGFDLPPFCCAFCTHFSSSPAFPSTAIPRRFTTPLPAGFPRVAYHTALPRLFYCSAFLPLHCGVVGGRARATYHASRFVGRCGGPCGLPGISWRYHTGNVQFSPVDVVPRVRWDGHIGHFYAYLFCLTFWCSCYLTYVRTYRAVAYHAAAAHATHCVPGVTPYHRRVPVRWRHTFVRCRWRFTPRVRHFLSIPTSLAVLQFAITCVAAF